MRITESRLRRIIKEVLETSEQPDTIEDMEQRYFGLTSETAGKIVDMIMLIKPAFDLILDSGFPNRMSRPLDPLDTFSRGCHPSQTVQQLVSPYGLVLSLRKGSVTLLTIDYPKTAS